MIVDRVIAREGRTTVAEFKCEHCGNIRKGTYTDTGEYVANIIPNIVCNICGGKTSSEGPEADANFPEGIDLEL